MVNLHKCPGCQRSHTNAGNLANHRKRCFLSNRRKTSDSVPSVRPTFAKTIVSDVNEEDDLQQWQREENSIRSQRQVCLHLMSVTICPMFLCQTTNPCAPFKTYSDMVWSQFTTEEGVGKRVRSRAFKTFQAAGFEVQEMEIRTEGQREKMFKELPGGVGTSNLKMLNCKQQFGHLGQRFETHDLAREGDKLKQDGSGDFIDPVTVQYRNVLEVTDFILFSNGMLQIIWADLSLLPVCGDDHCQPKAGGQNGLEASQRWCPTWQC